MGSLPVSIPDAEAALAAPRHPAECAEPEIAASCSEPPTRRRATCLPVFPLSNKSDNVLAKIDYTINAHHTLSGTYFLGNDNNVSQDDPLSHAGGIPEHLQDPDPDGDRTLGLDPECPLGERSAVRLCPLQSAGGIRGSRRKSDDLRHQHGRDQSAGVWHAQYHRGWRSTGCLCAMAAAS